MDTSIFSDPCKTRLQAAILAACAEATQYLKQSAISSSDPLDFQKPVLDLVYSAFQQHARNQNALQSAMAKLNDDVLLDIFAHLSFGDRIRGALVCHRWREVSLASPGRLWSTVPALQNLEVWAALLDRARDVPVTLERILITGTRAQYTEFILEHHMHHIKSLDLRQWHPAVVFVHWDDYSVDEWWSDFLDDVLALPGPALESLVVHFYEEMRRVRHALPILASPGLRTIKLHDIRLLCLSSCAGSPVLRTLVLDELGLEVPGAQDWSLVASFSGLEDLCLRLSASPPETPSALSIDLPRTLKRLHLEIDGDYFRLLLDSFIPHIDRIPRCKVSFLGTSCTTRELLPLLPGLCTDVAFLYSYGVNFMVAEQTGAQRIFQNVEPDGSWLQVLSGAEKVSYAVNLYPDAAATPLPAGILDTSLSFARLRELTFDMSPPQPLERWHYDPDRDDRRLEWPYYGSCPQLRVVRVRSHGPAVRVLVNSVVYVLARLLDPTTGHRLSALAFDGIHLVLDPDIDTGTGTDDVNADVLLALRPLADSVSVRFDGAAWPQCHLMWNETWQDVSK